METLDFERTNVDAYPERGLKAYSVVLGAWLVLFPASGLLNSTGIFQAWLLENHLQAYTESDVAWVFSTFAFLFFFGGFVVGRFDHGMNWLSQADSPGPSFDRYGSKMLLPAGCVGLVTALLCTSFCKGICPRLFVGRRANE